MGTSIGIRDEEPDVLKYGSCNVCIGKMGPILQTFDECFQCGKRIQNPTLSHKFLIAYGSGMHQYELCPEHYSGQRMEEAFIVICKRYERLYQPSITMCAEKNCTACGTGSLKREGDPAIYGESRNIMHCKRIGLGISFN